jgi:hypothetical protein
MQASPTKCGRLGRSAANGPQVPPTNGPQVLPTNGDQVPSTNGPQVPPTNGLQVPPTIGPQVPLNNSPQVPPTNGPHVPPTNGTQVPPANDTQVPPTHVKTHKLLQVWKQVVTSLEVCLQAVNKLCSHCLHPFGTSCWQLVTSLMALSDLF